MNNIIINGNTISIISTGVIILIIPMLFFTIGKQIEQKIIKREIKRYVDNMKKIKIYPESGIEYVQNYLLHLAKEPEIIDNDKRVRERNAEMFGKTFTVCTGVFMIMISIGIMFIYCYNVDYCFISYSVFINVCMFILIEVFIFLFLLHSYCPLDINSVNRQLLERVF